MCLKYAGPNTHAYWEDFLADTYWKSQLPEPEHNWKFVVSGEDEPKPPKTLLDTAVRMETGTIALFFASEEDIKYRYGDSQIKHNSTT